MAGWRIRRPPWSTRYGPESRGGSRAVSPVGGVWPRSGKSRGDSHLLKQRLVICGLFLRSGEQIEDSDTAVKRGKKCQRPADVLTAVIGGRDARIRAFRGPNRMKDVAFFNDLRFVQMIFQF